MSEEDRVLSDGPDSIVVLFEGGKSVRKSYKTGSPYRELWWLTTLGRGPFQQDWNVIHMPYLGEPLTKELVPWDWEDQAQSILRTMKNYSMFHNNITLSNLVVQKGRKGKLELHLIDFRHATMGEEPLFAPNPDVSIVNEEALYKSIEEGKG